ncbi:MAG: hypothetical protein COB73_07895 [Flavobacteriaceae bacterium]|nr:MAG: hypothetical protein COB73_07895 [Flavobacteriaceae bacterium]
MKSIKILSLISLFIFASCSSIKVEADYDTAADFSQYKTFAFYKKGIEKVDISSLDKKRIIKAIEQEMLANGFTLSSKPDIVVNIFAKSTKKVTVHNNFYGGGYYWQPYYYYGPYYGMNYGTSVSEYDEGTLFIDFIDNKKKELIWQGVGKGALNMNNAKKKDEIVKEFVKQIIAQYPPKVEEVK